MMVLVSYDVNTTEPAGRKRLRMLSKECLDFGRRVQYSVYECDINPGQWETLKHNLLDIYKSKEDSLRFYFLGSNWQKRVEHHGVQKSIEPDDVHFV